MPSVPPPLWPTTTLTPAGGGTMTAGVIGTLPPDILARLTPGTTLEARILSAGRGPDIVLLPGSEQPVSLRLPMPVPTGGTLLLQAMAQGGENATLKLIAVNPPPPAPPGGGTGTAPSIPGMSPPVPPPAAPPAGATVLPGQPAPPAGAASAAAGTAGAPPAPPGIVATLLRPTVADLPPGTLLTVRIAGLTPPPSPAGMGAAGPSLPPGTPTPAPVPAAPPAPASPPSSAALPTAAAPAAPQPQPLPGGALQAGTPATAGAASPPPQSLTGTVASNSYAGQPLVATSLGLLSLATPQTLAPGTLLLLDIVGLPNPPAAGSPSLPALPWPALTDAADALSRAAPEALTALAARLPQPGAQLAANLFTLFSAAVRGTPPRWLGGMTEALEKVGRRDLADAATEEMDALIGKPLRGRGGDDWQSWLLPLLVDGRIERIRLMTRPQPEDEEEKNRRGQEGVRFLLDLDLSLLGPMQLDGLIRREAQRFDLILRTHDPLPMEMRQDIRRIFTAALDEMGMTGEAGFQRSDRFVAPEPPPEPPDVTV